MSKKRPKTPVELPLFMMRSCILENAQGVDSMECSCNYFVKVKTQSMFTGPNDSKETNDGGSRKTTAAEGQFPASQGAESKAQGT